MSHTPIVSVLKMYINTSSTSKNNCFCLNQLACHHYKTIHKMRFSFPLVYRYIFCLLSRRLMQIVMQGLNIIYSFCSSILFSSSFIWQHVPDYSFSLVCILQHFVSSTDILHIPHVRSSYNYKYRTYHHVPLKNSGNYSYNFYTLSSLFKYSQNLFRGLIIHFLIILGLLNIVEESIRIFCFPFTTIFNIPFTGLNLPVEWYFIPHREGWYTPD